MANYIRVGEVAELLRVNARIVRRWLTSRRIDFYTTPGGERRVPASEVVRILGRPIEHIFTIPEAP